MTTIYQFQWQYKKDGVAYTPSAAPTVEIVGRDNTVLVAAGTAVTAVANLPGVYVYDYTGADDLNPIGILTTGDTTVDENDLASYTPGFIIANLDGKITTRLAAAAYTAPDNATVALIKALTDKLNTMLALDGAVYQYTANALENTPGGTATVSDADKTDIAQRAWNPTYVPIRTVSMSAAQLQAAVDGDDLECKRGDIFIQPFTGLGSLVGRTALFFTVKSKYELSDDDSTIQISEVDGLVRLNGQDVSGADMANGSLVVDDADEGNVTLTIKPGATFALPIINGARYDIQLSTATLVQTKAEARFDIKADVTRRIS